MLFYQDFNEQFEGYTQRKRRIVIPSKCCFIRISMSNLKDIHNNRSRIPFCWKLFYQDFNEQFEGYTQRNQKSMLLLPSCFIRISMSNLKDIHNYFLLSQRSSYVVLSGFQWAIWRIYTTKTMAVKVPMRLFYQDFNEQFEGYTQPTRLTISANCVVLSGFQWAIWRIYTTRMLHSANGEKLFYQDFNEQFEGYTQLAVNFDLTNSCCFIRISMNNLKDIHNILTNNFYYFFRKIVFFVYFICTCQKNVLPLCREWDVQYLARGMVLLTSQRPSWSLFYFRYFVLNAYTFTPTPSIVHTILWIYAVTPNFSAYSILFSYPSITFFSLNNALSWKWLFYQDFNEQFVCKSTKNIWNMQIYMKIFCYFKKK